MPQAKRSRKNIRDAILLRNSGMSAPEIATKMAVSERTVRRLWEDGEVFAFPELETWTIAASIKAKDPIEKIAWLLDFSSVPPPHLTVANFMWVVHQLDEDLPNLMVYLIAEQYADAEAGNQEWILEVLDRAIHSKPWQSVHQAIRFYAGTMQYDPEKQRFVSYTDLSLRRMWRNHNSIASSPLNESDANSITDAINMCLPEIRKDLTELMKRRIEDDEQDDDSSIDFNSFGIR